VIGEDVRIEEGAVLRDRVTLYPHSSVGARTVLHSGVVIREQCRIGADCILHNNTVIGADGFGYVPDRKVGLRKVPQIGNVEIGDRVEIGSNTCIDRGAFGSTLVGAGTKIDNLVQIGHNVVIGSNCIICGQVGIAGSAVIGDRVVLGGSVGVADHVTIVPDVRIGARGAVHTSIEKPGDYAGFPIMPARAWRRMMARNLKESGVTESPNIATKEQK
jgi:UDP-3-O-[3-hydroxymyristoyl] glucosamine N-acyltransferase LpxD